MGKPASKYRAQNFNPDEDIQVLKENYSVVKIKVETQTDYGVFTEIFGFDHSQYPDGSWKEHIDLAINQYLEFKEGG